MPIIAEDKHNARNFAAVTFVRKAPQCRKIGTRRRRKGRGAKYLRSTQFTAYSERQSLLKQTSRRTKQCGTNLILMSRRRRKYDIRAEGLSGRDVTPLFVGLLRRWRWKLRAEIKGKCRGTPVGLNRVQAYPAGSRFALPHRRTLFRRTFINLQFIGRFSKGQRCSPINGTRKKNRYRVGDIAAGLTLNRPERTICIESANKLFTSSSLVSKRKKSMKFAVPRIWRAPTNHISDSYFCVVNPRKCRAGKNAKKIQYPDLPSTTAPVPHSEHFPVPSRSNTREQLPPSQVSGSSGCSEFSLESVPVKPRLNNSEELNDLVRDLNLLQLKAEILLSRQKQWNSLKMDV
ncbi:hypothetical protein EVAR_11003_1 [Eumeta japonica]|uniref:Uncharacterized protein n=1 Tax=Eumeta variegata TaxID=151549 RepID=A0A4C1YHQ3_EUMVA|nr:hypothetical protein EVAR_11003_1 [Eumeta japonica]